MTNGDDGGLDPALMDGINMNTPSTTTPSPPFSWDDYHAEMLSFRTRLVALERHADWITGEYKKAVEANQKLSDEVETLTKTVDDQAAVIEHLGRTRAPSSNEIKGADPPLFEGNPRELDAWILACRLRFSLQPSKFAAEETKVQFAISFLKGPPKLWVNPLASKFFADRTSVPEFESFETFVTSIRSLYGDPNLAQNAMNQLKVIKQTTSVPEFYSRFIGVSQYTPHGDAALRGYFYDGLKETIKDELAKIPTPCLTLASLKNAATQLDSRMQERKWEKEHLPRRHTDNPTSSHTSNPGTRLTYSKPPPIHQAPVVPFRPYQPPTFRQPLAPAPRPAPPRPAPTPVASADGATPMELDSQRLRPLSEAEREKCLRENRCLRCRLQGHGWRECPGRLAIAAMEIALSENDESQE
jgi:hypothetical protein